MLRRSEWSFEGYLEPRDKPDADDLVSIPTPRSVVEAFRRALSLYVWRN